MSTFSFPKFPELPTELRIKIWFHASSSSSILAFKSADGRPFGITEASRVARVCAESRDVVSTSHTLMQYRCILGGHFSTYRWIDFSTTFLYLDARSYDPHFDRQAMRIARLGSNVQHLAIKINIGAMRNDGRDCIFYCRRLGVFPNLKTLVVVIPPVLGKDVRFLRDVGDLQRLRRLIDGEIKVDVGETEVKYFKDMVSNTFIQEYANTTWHIPEVRVVASDLM